MSRLGTVVLGIVASRNGRSRNGCVRNGRSRIGRSRIGTSTNLTCHSCHVMSQMSCPDCLVKAVLPRCPILVGCCPSNVVIAVMLWPSCTVFFVLTSQSGLSSPAFLPLTVLSWFPVPDVLSQVSTLLHRHVSFQSCSERPILSFLSCC